MQTYEIIVSGRAVRANSADTTLVRTSVGIDKIHVLFDNEEWRSFPVRVTFANGETLVSTSVTLAALESDEWAAEAECTIPWEVIQTLGGIRITFQGTDSSGKHIITEASGTPLTVVEAGDVVDGSEPQPDPTIDEWHQAYADAMAAASDAASAAEQISEILHGTDAQTLEELIAALGSALRYKGSVATYADLPEDAEQGDTYNVAAAYGDYPAGTNWAWTGTQWDALGGSMANATQSASGLMSAADKAKLDAAPSAYGDGLTVTGSTLSLGPLVGEGNPTRGCAIFGVGAEGWARQASTVGKNLLDCSTAIGSEGGLTFASGSNGGIKLSGTNSSSVYRLTNGNTALSPSTTYVISGMQATIRLRLTLYDNNNAQTREIYATASSAQFTTSASEIKCVAVIVVSTGTYNTTFYPQLEAGSTATSYEPYSGGAPSPSPDYPQAIEVARGRNLFTRKFENMIVNNDGSVAVSTGVNVYVAAVARNTDYVVSAIGKNRCNVTKVPSENITNGMSGTSLIISNASANTFNSGDADYVAVYLCSTGAESECQLELGSTPTPYVPYGHVGLEVQGRNLASRALNPSSSGQYVDALFIDADFKADTDYMISFIGTNGHKIYTNENLFTETHLVCNGTRQSVTLHTVSSVGVDKTSQYTNGYGWRIFKNDGGNSVVPNFSAVMLELGDAAHAYEPYHRTTTPIPLPAKGWAGGLPDGTADALAVDSAGRWEWTGATGKAVFDGDESWVADNGRFRLLISEIAAHTAESAAVDNGVMSSHFVATSNSMTYEGAAQGVHRRINGMHELIASRGIAADTLTNWTTWLASNPVTVLYPLATPATEHGYLDLPALPEGSTVTIPELSQVGVSWWVAGAEAAVEHASNERRRIESRLTALESAVAEIATA